ncbi:MAG: prepilin-type N-terminal cleavage/methylation protein [Rickettsiales bacterium]|jgi:prepilin-type N-terminal cleavage/methylation domain-containing protein|nr:prepilin-type N-terminal cleavage/methylation protein [Rickettsiales bacterium]
MRNSIILKRRQKQKGFTLIELSIVLIIIGLIVSGVLVGQDLIDGAKLRAQIGQIGEFNAAVNTFKLKYDALPGDIANPANYALSSTNITGDGDGGLEDDQGAILRASDEITGFWTHLSQASLIPGAYVAVAAGGTSALTTNIPNAKIGTGGVGVYGVSGINYYHIGATAGAADVATFANNLTPLQARTIDSKMDDGVPGTGIVLARTGTAVANSTVTGNCVTDVGADTTITSADIAYTLSELTKACQLRLKMN